MNAGGADQVCLGLPVVNVHAVEEQQGLLGGGIGQAPAAGRTGVGRAAASARGGPDCSVPDSSMPPNTPSANPMTGKARQMRR